jgi:hypothetical protein
MHLSLSTAASALDLVIMANPSSVLERPRGVGDPHPPSPTRKPSQNKSRNSKPGANPAGAVQSEDRVRGMSFVSLHCEESLHNTRLPALTPARSSFLHILLIIRSDDVLTGVSLIQHRFVMRKEAIEQPVEDA